MKRHLFSVVLVVLLLVLASSVGISETYPSRYDPDTGVYDSLSTDKRNVFEFCDLFQESAHYLNDVHGFDAEIGYTSNECYTIYKFSSALAQEKGMYYAGLKAGRTYINIPDFTIGELQCEIYSSSSNRSLAPVWRAISAICALEYDFFDRTTIEALFSINPSLPMNALESAINIFSAYIAPRFNDSAFMNEVFSADPSVGVLCYSGRYDYYLRYLRNEESDQYWVTLAAVAK